MRTPFTSTSVAIAFVALFSCLVLLASCDDLFQPKQVTVVILTPENVTAYSADLVVELTTIDESAMVTLEYTDGVKSEKLESGVYPANKKSIVKFSVNNLKPGTKYQLTANAGKWITVDNIMGYVQYAEAKPKEFITLDPTILKIKSIKSDFTNIDINLEVIPKVPNTKIQLQYQVGGTTITQLSPILSGNSTVEVNFKLENLTKNTDYEIHFKSLNEFATKLDTIYKTAAVSDYDGNTYRIVTIGTQVWLMENFKGTHFLNGDPIPNITDQSQWEAATSPAYCYYNNDIKNADTYGALYNWYVASDSRGLISGYHTPSEAEFRTITNYLGGNLVAGGAMKEAGFTHWVQPNKGATNSSGFTGLPAGVRKENFSNLGDGGIFWTKDKFMGFSNLGYAFDLRDTDAQIVSGGDYLRDGLSLRLIKN